MKLKATHKDKLSDGKPLGGRGRLTEDKLLELQIYYGLAAFPKILLKQHTTQTMKLIVLFIK